MTRHTGVVFLVASLSLSGCSCHPCEKGGPLGDCLETTPPGPCTNVVREVVDSCSCQTAMDCQGCQADAGCTTASISNAWACTNTGTCTQMCAASSDCGFNLLCLEGVCVPIGCGDDSECTFGQQCVAGTCAAAFSAANVASCAVLPATAVLNAGGSKTFWVVSRDGDGNQIAYSEAVTWGVTGIPGATATASMTSETTATVSGSMLAGAGAVTATIGSVPCAAASVTTFAAQSPGTLRVTVADQFSGAVIPAATVVDGSGAVLAPGGDGTYAEPNPNPAGTNTVSAFAQGYGYVTVVDTASTDLFLPLRSNEAPGTFTGSLTASDFQKLFSPLGTVHLAISGSSLAGNLIDFSLSSLLGASVPTSVNIGGNSNETLNIPASIVIGLGTDIFKSADSVLASPGIRSLWSLGGNIAVSEVLTVGPGLEGGSVETLGQLLTGFGPVFAQLESGVAGGVATTSGEQGTLTTTGPTTSATGGTTVHLVPDTLPLLQLSATLPNPVPYYLPTDTTGPSGMLDAAFVIGGVLPGGQGFVPLGLAFGSDEPDPLGIASSPTGPVALPFKMAPRSGGLEGSPFLAVTVAIDSSTPLSSPFGTSSSSSSTPSPVALSGNVLLPGRLQVAGGEVTDITFPGMGGTFLGLPQQPELSSATRLLMLQATDVSGVAFHRLSLASASGGWQIYFPAGEESVQIPDLPVGFSGADSFAEATSAVLQSVTLNLDPTRSYTYDDVVSFQSAGVTLDDLTFQIDQFSAESVPLQN